MRKAKIVATIGPASESPEQLRQLMLAGMDVARINMSHGEREHHGEVIDDIRKVAAILKKPVAIMLDLSGPKIRTGKLRGDQVTLKEGDEVEITPEEIEGDAARFSASYPLLAGEVQPNDRILISDGEIELQVISTRASGVVARVIHGGVLGENKGINLPGAQISIPSITEKDIIDLQFGITHGVDIVAQSFVRSADDCQGARKLIKEFGGNVQLVAKIEKPEAVADFANILKVADGIMVARGDLAVETSPERVPVIQKSVIAESLKAQRFVITATQMLQSMIENPRPTRAEASDVANAVLDGSDAVMLSGETAVGKFPVESVIMMDRIIRATEQMGGPVGDRIKQVAFGHSSGSFGRAVAEASVFAADEVGCRSIAVITESGHMAQRLVGLRPHQRIIALTPVEATYRQLAVLWGVEPHLLTSCTYASDEVLKCVDQELLEYDLGARGESVVVMAGRMKDVTISLSMKLHTIGDFTPE